MSFETADRSHVLSLRPEAETSEPANNLSDVPNEGFCFGWTGCDTSTQRRHDLPTPCRRPTPNLSIIVNDDTTPDEPVGVPSRPCSRYEATCTACGASSRFLDPTEPNVVSVIEAECLGLRR
jgi:hypothetical protein